MIKKADSRSKRFLALALAFSSFIYAIYAVCTAAFPQTVRSKAEQRFSTFGWAEKSDDEDASGGTAARSIRRFQLLPADSEEGASLEQDSSPFPAAPLAALMPAKPAQPILPDAGSLDISAAPPQLVSLFSSIVLSLKSRDYSGIKAASTSPFIPIMLEHMTHRLPQIEDAWFAGIEVAPDERSARAALRLRLAGSPSDGSFEPVLAFAEAVFEEGEWRAVDVIFDGDSYERASKRAGM